MFDFIYHSNIKHILKLLLVVMKYSQDQNWLHDPRPVKNMNIDTYDK